MAYAVVFGSWARGEEHADSDVDIAVAFTRPDVTLARELALQGRLEAALGRPVDLVGLAAADPPLAWRIARDGQPILERTPHAWDRFRVATAILHDDLRWNTERALAGQHRLLAAGR